jgi:hypothetical protein
MSHTTSGTILHSLLDTFDPASTHYVGVRDHFGAAKLARIDELRAKPDDYHFTFDDRLFIGWALSRTVLKASNPDE